MKLYSLPVSEDPVRFGPVVTKAVFTWARITFRKTFQNVIWPFPDFSPCECKAVSNQAFEMRFETRKQGRFVS